jgi:hypothetical protein
LRQESPKEGSGGKGSKPTLDYPGEFGHDCHLLTLLIVWAVVNLAELVNLGHWHPLSLQAQLDS